MVITKGQERAILLCYKHNLLRVYPSSLQHVKKKVTGMKAVSVNALQVHLLQCTVFTVHNLVCKSIDT